MIDIIFIHKHKGINQIVLRDLGRINVFCGKNNSGKSSILLSIQQGKIINIDINYFNKKLEGLLKRNSLPLSRIEFITKEMTKIIESFNYFGDHENIHELISEVFDNTLVKFKKLYDDDSYENFINEDLMNQNDRNIIYKLVTSIVNIVFQDFINNDKSISNIFIPPIRMLDVKIGNAIWSKNIEVSDGKGIIGKLFSFQNQLINSNEMKYFMEIKRNFNIVTEGCDFSIILDVDNSIYIKFSTDGSKWVNADDCGLGLRDVLVIIYFCIVSTEDILLIEEPESHLHPKIQRNLLEFMANQNKQYFISTHSNIFLDLSIVDKVFHVTYKDNKINVSDETKKAEILNNLGYTINDNIASDIIILVEGPTDIPILQEFLIKMDIYSKYNVSMWPLGGEIMSQLDLSIFNHHKIIALIDKDPKSKRGGFKRKCKENSIDCFQLERYAIENYFTLAALKEVFPIINNDISEILPDKKLEDQIGLNVKKRNRYIARHMSLEDIYGTDFYEFLNIVKEKLEQRS